jgi:tRNA(Ile)-lysidine synthase
MELTTHITNVANEVGIDLKNKRFILACSGGVDSMVLAYLFKMLNVNCILTHVNYGLRGVDADNAEKLVGKTAGLFNWPFEVLHAKNEMQAHKGESTQMAARRIRYDWFDELRKKYQADYLVLAHHKEDQVETFFIQLLRAASGEGLSGMLALREFYFRPLLAISKVELIAFAQENNIIWEEDGSNKKDDYLRNKIRHHVLPALNEINQYAVDAICDSLNHLKSEKALLNEFTDKFKKQNFSVFNNGWKIEKSYLLDTFHAAQLLYELLKSYGFNFVQCKEITAAMQGKHGANFYSPLWCLYVDRTFIYLLPIENKRNEILMYSSDQLIIEPLEEMPSSFQKEVAIVDKDKLSEHLTLRPWNMGDYFYPLGMKGSKKISDFYTDIKLTKDEKESQLLLLSDNEVVWVVNKRVDQRFAAGKESKNIVRICLKQ